ncbi:conserved protein of unknown function [Pseudomonas marincola]|uniref:Uncharacterized protein n=1 Tax=Pseudomonas marincola TaxID=437900 RepID=A0A653E8D0_9PSED|nr:conserved protein of unknown function [Pseudomonas marincola]
MALNKQFDLEHNTGCKKMSAEYLTAYFIRVICRPAGSYTGAEALLGCHCDAIGSVAEWFKATVLKTVDCNRS